MSILVTGAAGFLGSHLVDRLLNQGKKVIGLDNLYTGNIQNLKKALRSPNFLFVNQDVTEPIDFEVTGIFNLACPASPVQYQKKPVETITTSFLGALNCLRLATKFNARILQASTSEVYGDPTISPQHEEYWGNVNPIGLRSCYDEGKRAAETLFFDFHREYGTRIKVARVFNTYGPRMDFFDGRVVSNFIYQALNHNALNIYGNGMQTRSFCFVDDLIDGLIALFESQENLTGPVNLGNSHEFTILELATLVNKLTNSEKGILFSSLPRDDPKQRKPDILKAETLLNWTPKISLEIGLRLTILEFQSRLSQ